MNDNFNIKLPWRKLDNSAKIFPIISNKKFSTIFRLSVLLKEEINLIILKKALDITLNKFISFKVKLKKGFFWYYLESNTKDPIIEAENNYPCKYIDKNINNGYLFKVTYFNNKINLDVFHSLTDGNSAIRFFKELIYNYIELIYPNNFKSSYRDKDCVIKNNTEDSYLKNYDKMLSGRKSSRKAYILVGNKLPLYAIAVTHGFINLEQLKKVCKEKEVTITQYLTTVLIHAIYNGNYIKNKSKKPIKVCIPINLKNYFNSETITNFFSYITVEASGDKNQFKDFSKLLEFTKNDFESRLTKHEVIRTMSSNVKLGNNIFVRLIPLFIKNITIKMSYIEIRKYTTTTFSNIGRISMMPEYKKYVESFLLLLAPEKAEKIKCSACSYEKNLILTFTSILKDSSIERTFFDFLIKQGIEVKIKSNGVKDAIS